MGGHDEKLKNFGKSKKKIIDLYELDNSKKKIFLKKNFQNRDKQMSFFDRFWTKVKIFFDRSSKSNAVFGN